MALGKIGIFKVNEVAGNSSINFGPSIHKGLKADEKAIGGQALIGDYNLAKNMEWNVSVDPDGKDQVMKKY
ncbi:spore germination protein [Caldalkalibacillus salinus]|uniref:spore germination protein n=1 Tax=Caldalkalibacillus salinus TaxID=2803787 RepID=UPI001921A7D6|nr:spore germination protein [Caldalkalibacillus salinus]